MATGLKWRDGLIAALASVALLHAFGSSTIELARAEQPRAGSATSAPPLTQFALKQVVQANPYAFIPSQCYTKTIDASGKAHNPCYTCHVDSRAPNFINDGEVQQSYDFVPAARLNRWTNLFVDWARLGAGTSNEDIVAYVRKSNYFDESGGILLARQLSALPKEWDYKDDGRWSGYVPDARYDFDDRGFDRLPDGGYTGWRAYAYYPLPGTFWPTNGSMGDALVRLPGAFRESESGRFDSSIYQINLAIVEALILQRDVLIEPTQERVIGADLDLDGRIAIARSVRFSAAAAPGMRYVGRARVEQAAGRVHLAPGLFPEGSEFLHSVRYLDVAGARVVMAPRFKELRYARKAQWWTGERLDQRARNEVEDKADTPAEVRALGGDLERGVSNGQGWWYQGFIEDEAGALRPQSFEETAYCVGCHGGLGRTDDSVFSFGRRLGPVTFQRGWFHWTDRDLSGVPDLPIHAGTATEYVTYLEENGAADEFRQNSEARARFFDAQGRLKREMKRRLQLDISELILPSRERALALNKAYRALVQTQRFSEGRDVVLGGAVEVHRSLEPNEKTGVVRPVLPGWQGTRYRPASAAP